MSHPIPRPPGAPLLGNILDVDPTNTWSSLKKLSEEYGEIFQIKVFRRPIIFVAGAALAEEICDEKRFRKYVSGPIAEINYAVHDVLFTLFDHEADWGFANRVIAPTFSPKGARSMFNEMEATITQFVKHLKGLSPSHKKILVMNHLNRLNLERTAITLYGQKFDCLTGPERGMIEAMGTAISEAIVRPSHSKLINWILYSGKFKRSTKKMRRFAVDAVRARKEHPTDRQDLLWALLNGKDPETGNGLTEKEVVEKIITVPIGSSMVPGLLAAAIYFLTGHPDVVTKARIELDAVMGNGPFEYEKMPRLKYTTAVLREVLRLSFVAPGFNIEPIPRKGDKSPILLGGGKYEIAHNQPMIIVLAGVNRDPSLFEEPLVFWPERMTGNRFDALPLGVKRFFGDSKRECIGKHWAWQFSLVALAKMIKEIDFEKAEPASKMTQEGWFNLRPIDFYVKVKGRSG